jgi:hypothetical protein
VGEALCDLVCLCALLFRGCGTWFGGGGLWRGGVSAVWMLRCIFCVKPKLNLTL